MSVGAATEGVRVRGRKAAYWRRGRGPLALLVHGIGATSHIWEALAGQLEGELELLAVDLPGSGGSEAAAGSGPEAHAAFLVELLDALGIPRVHLLVGHSMGGTAALELALSEPHRIGGLMLANAAPTLPLLARLPLLAPGVEALLALPDHVPALRSRRVTRLYLRQIFGDARRLTPEVVDGYARAAATPGFYRDMAENLVGYARHRRRADELARIAAPTAIVWGEQDPFLPVAIAEKLARTLSGATLHRLPGCGHCPPQECPEMVAELVRALAGRVHASPPRAGGRGFGREPAHF